MSYLTNALQSLLTSKESECRTGGLNILGSLCGFGYNFEDVQVKDNLDFFRRNCDLIPISLWEIVYELQFDWDQTNQAASVTLIQLGAPKNFVKWFIKNKTEGLTLKMNKCYDDLSSEGGDSIQSIAKYWKDLKDSHSLIGSGNIDIQENNRQTYINDSCKGRRYQTEDLLEEKFIFWVEQLENEEIKELISMFRNEFKPPQTLWIERVHYNMEESKQEDIDQNGSWVEDKQHFDGYKRKYYQQFQCFIQLLDKEEEMMDLDDLGIIEIDDEEWNEYDVVDSDNSRRKIPNLKQKISNISPQLKIRDKSPSTRLIQEGQSNQNLSESVVSQVPLKPVVEQQHITEKEDQMKKGLLKQNYIEKEAEDLNGEDDNMRGGKETKEMMSFNEGKHFRNVGNSNEEGQNIRIVEDGKNFHVVGEDGENVRIVDELELMDYLRSSANEDKPKQRCTADQNNNVSSVSQNKLQTSSRNSQARRRSITPPINEDSQHIEKQRGDEGQVQYKSGYTSRDLHVNLMHLVNRNHQQKSEDYIYSDSAESDDYQDVFINQQEQLFRQQRQQKYEQNSSNDIPNRPLSAKLKKNDIYHDIPNPLPDSVNQALYYHSFGVHQSASLSFIPSQSHPNQQEQCVSTKQTNPDLSREVKSLISQNIQAAKSRHSNEESSDEEHNHIGLLQSRYGLSKNSAQTNASKTSKLLIENCDIDKCKSNTDVSGQNITAMIPNQSKPKQGKPLLKGDQIIIQKCNDKMIPLKGKEMMGSQKYVESTSKSKDQSRNNNEKMSLQADTKSNVSEVEKKMGEPLQDQNDLESPLKACNELKRKVNIGNLLNNNEPKPTEEVNDQQIEGMSSDEAGIGSGISKFILDKVNLHRLVSVPSNYNYNSNQRAPFERMLTIQSNDQSGRGNSHTVSHISTKKYQSTFNGSQSHEIMSHGTINKGMTTHNNLNSNIIENVQIGKQAKSNTSSGQKNKKQLLKKLMVKNIDFNDLKSVWKMNSEIKKNSMQSHQQQVLHQNYLSKHSGNLLPSSGYVLPSSGNEIPSTGYVLPSAGYVLPSPGYVIPSGGYALPRAGYVLPSAGYVLSSAVEEYQSLRETPSFALGKYLKQQDESKFQRSNSLGRASSTTAPAFNLHPNTMPLPKSKKEVKKKKKLKKNQNDNTPMNDLKASSSSNQLLPSYLQCTSSVNQTQKNTARNTQADPLINNIQIPPDNQSIFKKVDNYILDMNAQRIAQQDNFQSNQALSSSTEQTANSYEKKNNGKGQVKNIYPEASDKLVYNPPNKFND